MKTIGAFLDNVVKAKNFGCYLIIVWGMFDEMHPKKRPDSISGDYLAFGSEEMIGTYVALGQFISFSGTL